MNAQQSHQVQSVRPAVNDWFLVLRLYFCEKRVSSYITAPEFDVLHCRVLLRFAPITVKNKIHTKHRLQDETAMSIMFECHVNKKEVLFRPPVDFGRLKWDVVVRTVLRGVGCYKLARVATKGCTLDVGKRVPY